MEAPTPCYNAPAHAMVLVTTRRLAQGGILVLGALLGVFLGWVALRGTDWSQVGKAMGDFPLPLLAVALALFVVSAYLRAVRWRLLWTTERVTVLRLFWIENAALGLNNISPIRAMDEPLEFGILAVRDRLPGGTILATMMLSRIQDLAFTLLFVTVAVATLPTLLRFTPVIVVTSLFFVGWLFLLLNAGRVVRRFPRLRRFPGLMSFEGAVRALRARKERLAAAFGLTCAYWLVLGPLGWTIADGAGIDLSFHKIMVTVLGAIFFATALPGLPGSIGTFEFAVVSLLDLWGIPKEPAIAFAIILHAVLYLPPTLFTIVVLPWEGLASIGAIRKMVTQWREARSG